MEHIDNMDELKNGVGLRAYGQYDPVVVYRTEGGDMFEEMVYDIKYDVVRVMMHVSKKDEGTERKQSAKITDAKLASQQDAIDLVDGNLKPKDGGINKTVVNEQPKIGRNDLCPCGSRKEI